MPACVYDNAHGNWYKGNLHLHTTVSDGHLSIEETARAYHAKGYDFICLTDHRKVYTSNGASLPLLAISGIELDGHDRQGRYYHVVAVGATSKLLERLDFATALDKARQDGAMLIWAHPHWTGNSFEDGERHFFDAIEIYNHSSQCEVGKGYANIYWDGHLERRPRYWGVAVDDAHFKPGHEFYAGGWVMVNAPDCTPEDLLNALKAGRFYSSQGPLFKSIRVSGRRVRIETSPMRYARLIGPRSLGLWRHAADIMTQASFDIPADWAYARLEIEDDSGLMAWTNPLFA